MLSEILDVIADADNGWGECIIPIESEINAWDVRFDLRLSVCYFFIISYSIRIQKYIERITLFNDLTLNNGTIMGQSSDLMMITSGTGNLTIIIKEIGRQNTHSPIYSMKDNWEN